jgi:large subunit ribosomal protein L28
MVNTGISKWVGFWSQLWYKCLSWIDNYREKKMPKACEICGKSPVFGQSLSHSHKASKKKWKPNLQKVKAQTQEGTKRIWVCTRCLRSGKVSKAV